jgi:hypothetical protein
MNAPCSSTETRGMVCSQQLGQAASGCRFRKNLRRDCSPADRHSLLRRNGAFGRHFGS